MPLNDWKNIYMYIGGGWAVVRGEELMYVNGKKVFVGSYDLDYLNFDGVWDVYKAAGGKGSCVTFYYKHPTQPLTDETAVREIWSELSLVELQNCHIGIDDVIMYAVRDDDGIVAGFDEDGNPVQLSQEKDGEEPVGMKYLTFPGWPPPQTEPDITQEDSSIRTPRSATEVLDLLSQTLPAAVTQEDPVITQVDSNLDVGQTSKSAGPVDNNDDDNADQYQFADEMFNNNPIEDNEFVEEDQQSEHVDIQNNRGSRTKRQRHAAVDPDPEGSDPGSDEEWEESDIEESESSEDSDVPSEALDDIEASSEDDIFELRDRSKKARKDKMKSMRKNKRKSKKATVQSDNEEVNADEEGWYSDPGEDERFDEAPLSDNETPRFHHWKEGDSVKKLKLTVGYKFDSLDVYKKVLIDGSIIHGYVLDFIKCESRRVTACYMDEHCDWRIHASRIQNSDIFQVKTIKGEHTCAKKGENFRARAKYLGEKMEQTIRDNLNVKIEDFVRIIQRKVGVKVSYWIAARAKKEATTRIKGEFDKEYELLWSYGETLLANNPGSKVIIKKKEDSNPPIFEKMYFSLRAMTSGFLAGCRPLIGLDGCFLKHIYEGQLLCDVGKDENENLFPIALAYVKTENYENWVWFLEELLMDIGGLGEDRWTFISDRQKGLLEAVNTVAPGSEHRFCLRHLYQNFYKLWKSQDLKNLFWRAASAGNKEEWAEVMKQMEALDPKVDDNMQTASEWLLSIPPEHWSRAHFRTRCKTDLLVNNICESFNNMILPSRDLPIISMFEWIRLRLIKRIQIKKSGMEAYEGNICPVTMKKINRQCELARYSYPSWCGEMEFQVDEKDDQFVVRLDKRTCTCDMFQLNGYPCRHACTSITDRRMKIEDFVDECYRKDTYLRVYSYRISALPGKKHYIQSTVEPLGPLEYKRKRGRQKKQRRKGAEETQNRGTRKGLTHTYQRCLLEGHNKRSCENPTHPNSRLYKGPTNEEGRSSSTRGGSRHTQSTTARRSSQAPPSASPTAPEPLQGHGSTPASRQTFNPPRAATAQEEHHSPPTRRQRIRKPTVGQVFQNMRDRAREKRNPRPWKL